ncbi:hypothetical protein QE152_g30649 [Popillia japonica]|uniref:Uncharacterized protein n=1 Tax=Popillia japonica TaxID=7064 RepID=A0AAW1JE39_POPJA
MIHSMLVNTTRKIYDDAIISGSSNKTKTTWDIISHLTNKTKVPTDISIVDKLVRYSPVCYHPENILIDPILKLIRSNFSVSYSLFPFF